MAGDMGMFGAPIGQHHAEQDIARMALLPLQQQKMQGEIMLQPFTAAQRSAVARHANAKAKGLERTANVEAQIAQIAAGETFSESDQINPGWQYARIAQRLGDPVLAMKYAKDASKIDQQQQSADTNRARSDLVQARTYVANLDGLSRNLGGVRSPEDLQTVLQTYQERTGNNTGMLDQNGMLLPQAAANWQEVTKQLQDSTVTERDRRLAKYREDALKSANQERESKQKNRDFWQNMDNQQARAEAQARARNSKSGGTTAADNAQLREAADLITSEFPDIQAAESRVRGREIRDRAKQLREANPALSYSDAIKQTFETMEKQGKFQGFRRKPQSADPNNPKPLPASGKKDDLRAGEYYTDSSGEVRRYLGNGKWSGNVVKGKISYNSPVSLDNLESDDTSEDDEDEDD